MFRVIKIIFIAVITFSLTASPSPKLTYAAQCSCPKISRDQIIGYAKTGVGSPYVFGGEVWDANHRKWGGADCSGYVAKCWMVPKAVSTKTVTGHPYNTSSFYSHSTHWYKINRKDLRRGDALVYRSGGSGHVVIYDKGDPSGKMTVYEARGRAYGIVHDTRTFSSNYIAIRRHNVIETNPAFTVSRLLPNGSLDSAIPKSWATTKLYLDNISMSKGNVYLTNTGSKSDTKSVGFKNTKGKISKNIKIGANAGSLALFKKENAKYITNSLGVIESAVPTVASFVANSGYIYHPTPMNVLSKTLYLEDFMTTKETLYITNPSMTRPLTVKINLYANGKIIYTKTFGFKAGQVKSFNWIKDKKVTSKAQHVFAEIIGNSKTLANRTVYHTKGYQSAKASALTHTSLYFDRFTINKDIVYLCNPNKGTVSVTLKLLKGGKQIYKTTVKISSKASIHAHLRMPSVNTNNAAILKLESKSKITAGKKTGELFTNLLPGSSISQGFYLDKFEPKKQTLNFSNPGSKTITAKLTFYSKGKKVKSSVYNINHGDLRKIDLSSSSVSGYHDLFVRITGTYLSK